MLNMLSHKGLFFTFAILFCFNVLSNVQSRPMSDTNEIINTLKDIDAALLTEDDDDADLDNENPTENDSSALKANATDADNKNATKEAATLNSSNSTNLNETQSNAEKLDSQSNVAEESKSADNVKSETAKDESASKTASEAKSNETKTEEKASARSNSPRDGGPVAMPLEAKQDKDAAMPIEAKQDKDAAPEPPAVRPAEVLTSEQEDPAPQGQYGDEGTASEGEAKEFSNHKQSSKSQHPLVPQQQAASLNPQANVTNLAGTDEGSGDNEAESPLELEGSGEEQTESETEDASTSEGSAADDVTQSENNGETVENIENTEGENIDGSSAEENDEEDSDKVKMFFISPFDKTASNDATARQILTYPAAGRGALQNHHGGPSHIWNSDYPYFAYGYSWGCGHHGYGPQTPLKKSDTKPKKDDLICRDYILLPALSHSSIMTVSPEESQENGVARQIVNKDIACNDNDAVCTQKQVIGSMAGGSLFGDGMGGLGMGFPGIPGIHTGISGYNMGGGIGDRFPTAQQGINDPGCCSGPAGYATQGLQSGGGCASCGGFGDGLGGGFGDSVGLRGAYRGGFRGRHSGIGWGHATNSVGGARFFHANDHGIPSFWGAKDAIPAKKPKNERPTKKATVKKTKVKKRQYGMSAGGFGFDFRTKMFQDPGNLNDNYFRPMPVDAFGPRGFPPQFRDSSMDGGVPVPLKYGGLHERPLAAAGWGSDTAIQNIPSIPASWGGVTDNNCIENEAGPMGCGLNNNRFDGSRIANLGPLTDKTIVQPEELNGFPGRDDARFVPNPNPVLPTDNLNNGFTGVTAVGVNSFLPAGMNGEQTVAAFGANGIANDNTAMTNFMTGGRGIGTAYVQGMPGVGTAEGFGPRGPVPGAEMAGVAAGIPDENAANFQSPIGHPNFAYKSKIKKKKAGKANKATVKGTTRQDIAMPDEQALMDVTKQRQLIGSLGASTLFADNVGGMGLGHPGVPGMSSGISGIPGEYGGSGGFAQGWNDDRPGLSPHGFNNYGYNYGNGEREEVRGRSRQTKPENAQDEQGQKREVITNASDEDNEGEANNRQIISSLPSDTSAPAQSYEQLPSEEHGYVPLVKLSHSSSSSRYMAFPRRPILNPRSDEDEVDDENNGGMYTHYGNLNSFYHSPDRNDHPRHVHVGVGTPSVKVEVETSKSEIARSPAVHVSATKMSEIRKLVHEVSDSLAKTNQKLKALKKHHTPGKPREKGDKRQITPAFTPVVSEPAAVPDIRYPCPAADRYPLGAGCIWPSASYGHQYGGPYAWSKSHTPKSKKEEKKGKTHKTAAAKTRRSIQEKDHKEKTGNKRQFLPSRPGYNRFRGGLNYGVFGKPYHSVGRFFGGRHYGSPMSGFRNDFSAPSLSPMHNYGGFSGFSGFRRPHHLLSNGGFPPGMGVSHGGFGPGGYPLDQPSNFGSHLVSGGDTFGRPSLSHVGSLTSPIADDGLGRLRDPNFVGGFQSSSVPFDGRISGDTGRSSHFGRFSNFPSFSSPSHSPFGTPSLSTFNAYNTPSGNVLAGTPNGFGGTPSGNPDMAALGFGGPGVIGQAAGIGGGFQFASRHGGMSGNSGLEESALPGVSDASSAMAATSSSGGMEGMNSHLSGFESDALQGFGRQNIAEQQPQGEQDSSQSSSQFMPMSRSQMPEQMPSMIPDNQQAMFNSQAMTSYGSDIRASEFPASKKSEVPKNEENKTMAKKE